MSSFGRTILFSMLFTAASLCAQQKPAPKPAAPAKPAPLTPASPASVRGSLPSEEVVNGFLKRMFGYDPNAKWQVLEIRPSEVPGMAHVIVRLGEQARATHLYVSPDGEWAVVGDVLPFGVDPFVKVRRELEERASGPGKGPKDAAILIVEFADLQCPSCKTAAPVLERLAAELPQARLVFQHFPLTQIHPWAMKASAYTECVRRQKEEAAWTFMSRVYDQQSVITEVSAEDVFKQAATAAGADAAAAAACAADAETEAVIRQSMNLGLALGVSGTPTVFINGRKIVGVNSLPYETLKAIAEFEIQQRGPAAGK